MEENKGFAVYIYGERTWFDDESEAWEFAERNCDNRDHWRIVDLNKAHLVIGTGQAEYTATQLARG